MATWHCKNTGAYAKTSDAGWDNIQLVYSNLVKNGFSEAAACGVLVNMEYEGGFNPWRWESDDILATTDWTIIDASMVHGYGLCGWTPSGKYLHDNWNNLGLYPSTYRGYGPNYSDQPGSNGDGHAQCQFIIEGQQYNWITTGTGRYPISVSEYRALTDPADAAEYWCRDYEYPANLETQVSLRRSGVTWYSDRLIGSVPVADPYDDLALPLLLIIKKANDISNGLI